MSKAFAQTLAPTADPAPEVPVFELAGSSVNLRARWWTPSKGVNLVRVQGEVLEAVKRALDRKGIDMSYPTQVVLFYDQTEGADRRRGEQREGWPVPPRHRGENGHGTAS